MKSSLPRHSRVRVLVLVQDGVGDLPVAALGGWTPLEAANTPWMDSVAARGATGLMDIVAPGIPIGTDTGHLALFGQPTTMESYGRGPMEAAGVGFALEPRDVAIRFNFATVDGDSRILDRRAGRIRESTDRLVDALNEITLDAPVEVFFRAATEHRGVLVLRGDRLSPMISDSDPGSIPGEQRIQTVQPWEPSEAAAYTADLVNQVIERSHLVLDSHPVNEERRRWGQPPANIILTRGAGSARKYLNLPRKLGLRVACVSAEATVLGLARLSGIDAFVTSAMTANLDTDLGAKAVQSVQLLQDYDLVYLHLKGCDIASHDRSPVRKKEFIEQTDVMVGWVLQQMQAESGFHIALVGDHSTLSEVGDHSDDPVPIVMAGPGVHPDEVDRYGERYCAAGVLGRISSPRFLELLFGLLPAPVGR